MVVRLTMGSHRVLLPGDIGVDTQELLARTRNDALRADILVAPHHGDLITARFWKCVDPAWVLVPVGPNPWELPDTTSLRVAAGRRLIDTRCDGTVVLSLGEEGIAVACRSPHSFTERREAEMAARIRRWRRAQ
jgi:competence protein ComEC